MARFAGDRAYLVYVLNRIGVKIFNDHQIKSWDRATLEESKISSLELMERASNAFVQQYMKLFDPARKVSVFCGPGNNGGDGLAIARILSMQGYDTKVWLVDWDLEKSKDNQINLSRLPDFGHIPIQIINLDELPVFPRDEIIIDALLGTGINRPLDGNFEELIYWLNSLKLTVVAVDVPSGLFSDKHTDLAVHATYTLSFQSPKLAFLLPEYEVYTGNWEILDIGLSPNFYLQTPSKYFLMERRMLKELLINRKKFSHKGLFGHALLINGSHGKGGAAILASRACLRSGVGLVTNHIPGSLYSILQMSVPEAMASVDEHDYYWSTLPKDLNRFASIGVGCGVDQKDSTKRVFYELLEQYKGRMVIDADGLNLMSHSKDTLNRLPPGSILTPHVKEFERLFGKSKNCFDRLDLLAEAAIQYQTTIILKGAYSTIALPDGVLYFNCSGNPGMATAGSGDVLTGLLTGLMAQGYDSMQTALLGVYLHGRAGDLALNKSSLESLIASDLVDHLGLAFNELRWT